MTAVTLTRPRRETIMAWYTRMALCLAVIIPAAFARVAPPNPKAKIEFRWLEGRHVKGLTENKGFQTTCGDALSYAHLQAILTNADIASARFTCSDLSAHGLGRELCMVYFRLSVQGKVKLQAAAGPAKLKELAVFVDGRYWGTAVYRPAEADFEPFAGMMSKAEAVRIVAACK
jgi:hypothetical protein